MAVPRQVQCPWLWRVPVGTPAAPSGECGDGGVSALAGRPGHAMFELVDPAPIRR
jgi:hypothetical protein